LKKLIFRGAMLYLLLNKIGARYAIMISAAGFWNLSLVFFGRIRKSDGNGDDIFYNRHNGAVAGLWVYKVFVHVHAHWHSSWVEPYTNIYFFSGANREGHLCANKC